MHDPLEQFRVYTLFPIRLGGLDLSFTNASLWMVIATALFLVLASLAMRSKGVIPNLLQIATEKCVSFVEEMADNYIGDTRYFFLIFSIFVFIGSCNLIGLIPYSFTVTSQIIVTIALALFVFLIATLAGIVKYGFGFMRFFVPRNVPKVMLPFLSVIEIISYLFRPISLAVRLFANMMAGHIMLKVFSGFSSMLGSFWGVLPLGLDVILTGFEIFIALLQAYVFSLLTCIYIKDATHLH